MAAAAGARRTGSVVARARASEQAPDVYLVPAFSDNGDLLDFESIAQFPEVIEAIRVPWLAGSVDGAKLDVLVLPRSMLDGKRLNIVSGRAPRGGGEAAVNFLARDALGWPAGTSISVDFAPPGADPNSIETPSGGPTASFEVSAVVAGLSDLGGDAEPTLYVDESFWAEHRDAIASIDLFMFRLRRGPDDLDMFDTGISRLTGGSPVFYVEGSSLIDQTQRSFQLLAGGLWILAAFLAVTAVLITSQLLLRLTVMESSEDSLLRAVGNVTEGFVHAWHGTPQPRRARRRGHRRGRGGGDVTRVPVGPAEAGRTPLLGVSIDLVIVVLGALAVVTVAALICAVPVWRRAKLAGRTESPAPASLLAAALGQVSPGRAWTIGARMALEPGRGRTAVPVRSSLASATLGVAALVMALTVGASLSHMLSTPRLYGWNWDVIVEERRQHRHRRVADDAGDRDVLDWIDRNGRDCSAGRPPGRGHHDRPHGRCRAAADQRAAPQGQRRDRSRRANGETRWDRGRRHRRHAVLRS